AYNIGMADLIQYMSIHATVTCPLGPRIQVFIGRKTWEATQASPRGLLPSLKLDADKLLAIFQDKTITPHDLAALLGAHTASKQFFVNEKQEGKPQDSTPGICDVGIYNETLQPKPVRGTFCFLSDAVLSKDNRLADEWPCSPGVRLTGIKIMPLPLCG
ncbi:heme peroxidase, partial [Hyaloscypha finlandica]